MNQASVLSSVVPVLPARLRPSDAAPAPRAVGDHPGSAAVHQVGDLRADRLGTFGSTRSTSSASVAVEDLLDEVRLDQDALVGEDAVGAVNSIRLVSNEPSASEG